MRKIQEFSKAEIERIRPALRRALVDDDEGLYALAILLQKMNFWNVVETESEIAVRNVAVWLLEMVGFLQHENIERLMRSWREMPYRPPVKEEEEDG